MNQVACPLCGWDAKSERERERDAYWVECDLCGQYVITGVLKMLFRSPDAEDRGMLPYLSAHTRQATAAGLPAVDVTTENWRDLTRGHMNTPVSVKVRKVLQYVSGESHFPGEQVEVNVHSMYPLFDAVSEEEMKFLLEHLVERVLLVQGSLEGHFILSVEGWSLLEPTAGGIPRRCFVAMSFDQTLHDAYEHGIRAAIKDDCGCDPVRVDKVHHNEKICDKILAEIRLAQFVIADFTLHRAGVYFEAGFAMGLGRPVIWTCRKDELAKAHFDTRQYNHIEWENPEELRSRLADRVRASILK